MPPNTEEISSSFPFTIQYHDVLGSKMAYVDTGAPSNGNHSPPLIFLHGNPTSSYLWRNIIPHAQPLARCIAPDLIGTGHSDRVPRSQCRFVDHYRYLSAFIAEIVPEGEVTLVIHDWGSALGLHWARLHEERVAGLVLMEFLRPLTWDEFPERSRELFRGYRGPNGREMLVEKNMFIEINLAKGLLREFSEAEMETYRKPYLEKEHRETLYRFPNEVPIEGSPADVWEAAVNWHEWLVQSEVRKLFFWGTPGALIRPEKAEWYGRTLKNVKAVDVGGGVHFLQEDNPHLIGREIAGWIGGQEES
jgi:haloalkane dehalogenase